MLLSRHTIDRLDERPPAAPLRGENCWWEHWIAQGDSKEGRKGA
jgi:hypothetical protein